MIIRTINTNDIECIVEIHIEAFSGFFLTTLGPSFLRQYYKSFIGNKDCISICAVDSNLKIVGFCVGTTNASGFHRRLIAKNFFEFFRQFLIILIKNPQSLLRLISNLEKQPGKQLSGIVSELLSIGVSLSVKGTGVGTLLLKKFEKELQSRNANLVTLTTDYYNNDNVIGFYVDAGYQIFCDFIAYPRRRMYKMIKHL